MVSCSSLASRSPSPRWLGICAAALGHRLRAGGRFSATMPTVSRRSTSFVLPTVAFQILYCLVILRHGRRFWMSFGVTSNPTAEWISRQITEAFPWDHAPAYLIRDRDRSYGSVFVRRLCAMGIRDRRFGHVINTDEVFGTHRMAVWHEAADRGSVTSRQILRVVQTCHGRRRTAESDPKRS